MPSPRTLAFEALETRSLLHAGHIHLGDDALHSSHGETTTNQPPAVVSHRAASSLTAGAVAAIVAEDAYENNDTFGVAANLGTLTGVKTVNNLVLNDTADWFKFTMSAAGTSSDYVEILFTHSKGDLDLELYNASGKLLSRSQGITSSERLSLQNLPTGTYFLRAFGYRGVHNPSYSLTIDPGAAALSAPTPTPTPTPTTTTTTSTGAFDIQLNYQGLTTTEQAIFQQAAARWEQIIIGDLPNATYGSRVVDDLLIDASAVAIDGVGGTLGQAGPDRFRSGTLMPYHGSMQFDTADLDAMRRNGTLLSIVEHEIGHILGIGILWDDRGLLAGGGTSNPRFTGQRATAEYNAIFGVHESGVPVENTGGAGTRDAHWRDSILVNELMTGWAGPGTQLPLSRITVASLADIGYQVDMSKASAYSRPSSTTATPTTTSVSSGTGAAALDAAYQRDRRAVDHVMTLWE
ncbi:MAG: leishmanolysin-related zinc metalloendopeptidase [Pirellulaceae bacterium]